MRQNKLDQRWLKAAVIGSIWAAFEIIVGSFLHNIHVPFSGTFLSTSSVFLLVAFMQVWKEPGVILRAGLICALMKSISPSAFILGPMIGIFLEAFLLEMTRKILGRNLIAYMIAGALAVSSTLLQKVGMLLFTFGFDLVAISKPFYFYLLKKTGLEGVSPNYLISGILIAYSLVGTSAALLGYFAGKNHLKIPRNNQADLLLAQKDDNRFAFDAAAINNFPFLSIALLFISMIGTMWLINISFLYKGIVSGGIFILLVILKYQHTLGRLKKVSLWLQFFLITLIATIFWEWSQSGQFISSKGLLIGLKMNYRAVIVILGFAAISIELRNPIVKALLSNNGFSALYNSLSLSFSALPALIGTLPSGKNFYRDSRNLIPNILARSEGLLTQFKERNEQFDHIYIITGGVHEGKTTFAEKVVEKLKNKKIPIEGFLAHGTFSGDRRHSFHIENIKTEEKHLLCIRESRLEWDLFGSFYFDPKILKIGNDLLKEVSPASVILIDEVGRLEFQRKEGWFEGLSHILHHHPKTTQIWTVRREFIPKLLTLFPIPEDHIFDIKETEVAELLKSVGV